MLNSGGHRALSLNQEAQRRTSRGTTPLSAVWDPSTLFFPLHPSTHASSPGASASLRCCLKPWRAAPLF